MFQLLNHKQTGLLFINISPVFAMEQYHDFFLVINFVSNSIITNSYAVLVFKSF